MSVAEGMNPSLVVVEGAINRKVFETYFSM
jgi:hypothetical protein